MTPLIVKRKWVKLAPRETHAKYLQGGNMRLLTEDFRGRDRPKAQGDITGYAPQEGTWTVPAGSGH